MIKSIWDGSFNLTFPGTGSTAPRLRMVFAQMPEPKYVIQLLIYRKSIQNDSQLDGKLQCQRRRKMHEKRILKLKTARF